jgi:hypothetical protein
MTILERKARSAILSFCKSKGHKVQRVRHIHPRAYVLARFAPSAIVIGFPWQDSEPHPRELERAMGTNSRISNMFEAGIRPGDWVSIGYVVGQHGTWTVAVKAVE